MYMSRYLPLTMGIALILAATVTHGLLTYRWSPEGPQELEALAQRYPSIPAKIGDWIGEDFKKDEKIMSVAGAKESISRRYRNVKTGQAVQIFLVCGLARDTAVHTPPDCYPGQGWTMEEKVSRRVDLITGDGRSQAWGNTFTKTNDQGVQICQRILWTWNGRDGWKAPDWPRGQYLGNSALNKLYLIGTALSVEKAAESEKKELAQFAEIFLPEVSRILYPPANRPAVPK